MSASSVSSSSYWRPPFYQGQQVLVIDGTFSGMGGEVASPQGTGHAVRVALTIFGRTVPVELDAWQLEVGRPMTEEEWLTCTVAPAMAWCLWARGRAPSARQMRLFACACTRWLAHALADECYRDALNVSERYADGQGSAADLAAARLAVCWTMDRRFGGAGSQGLQTAVQAVLAASMPDPRDAMRAALEAAWVKGEERRWQADLLRDIIGNPFRRAPIVGAWRRWNGGCVVKMARSIYDERHFEELPVLGDALEEAGCDNEEILSHCRRPGEHVRGCWVIDRLLRKK